MEDDKLFEYDDGLPGWPICLALVVTSPLWLPVALVCAMVLEMFGRRDRP